MRTSRNLGLAVVLGVACFGIPNTFGQSTQTTSPSDTSSPAASRIAAINLDVGVSLQDEPANGLSQHDFKVLDDGQPQTIVSFSAADQVRERSCNLRAQRPHTILLLDDLNAGILDKRFFRHALITWLKQNHGVLSQPTMLLALSTHGIAQINDYTCNGNALAQALEAPEKTVSNTKDHQGVYRTAYAGIALTLSTLQDIALSVDGVPSRKTLVWIAVGDPVYLPWQLSPYARERLHRWIEYISDQLLLSRITLDVVGNQGTQEPGIYASDNQDVANAIGILSDGKGAIFHDLGLTPLYSQTGGAAFASIDDVARALSRPTAWYTLSYDPSAEGESHGFRSIHLSVDRSRALIEARSGYYPLHRPSDLSSEQVFDQLRQALSSPLRYSGVPIVATKATASPDRNTINLKVYVDSNRIGWIAQSDGQLHCTLSIAAIDLSVKGKMLHATTVQTITYQARVGSGARTGGYVIALGIHLHISTPGDHVKLAVLDRNTGEIGTCNIKHIKHLPIALPDEPTLRMRQKSISSP